MEQLVLEREENGNAFEERGAAHEKARAASIDFARAFEARTAGLDRRIEQRPFYTRISSRS